MGGDAVRWQGATTLRAPARKAEQRRQRDAALLNRVRSGVTHEVMAGVGRKVCIHAVFPAEESGQLRFLGSMPVDYQGTYTQRFARFSAMNSDGRKRDRNSL